MRNAQMSDPQTTEVDFERAMKLVGLMPAGRRELVQEMLEGPVGLSFFTAPASSKREYHECRPGGLIRHSLNVVKNLKKIVDTFCPNCFEAHLLAFVGLFHDLGKASDGEHEYYIPNSSQWHIEKGMLYEVNKKLQK